MESFYLGISIGFLTRIVALRWIRWPLLSRITYYIKVPLKSLPSILCTGIFFSGLDLMRRVAI